MKSIEVAPRVVNPKPVEEKKHEVKKRPDHRLGKPEKKKEEKKEIKIIPIKKAPKKDETLLKFYYHTRQNNCDERSDILNLVPNQKLRIYSWNVNGLRNLFDVSGVNELQNFINEGK